MATTLAHEVAVPGERVQRHIPPDSGARLSYALLSYLVVLMAALSFQPFEFSTLQSVSVTFAFAPWRVLGSFAMFVPYGFLARRARTGRVGANVGAIMLSAIVLALAFEAVRLFEAEAMMSPWRVLASVAGAGAGALVCQRLHAEGSRASTATSALLLNLPLMGLVYLLIPLLWASAAAASGDPSRLLLTLCVGAMGASLLGSVARATRAYTPDRAWWLVSATALVWVSIGTLPFITVGWRYIIGIIVAVVAMAGWRGRWSAPAFVDRRYEVPSLLAASPCFLLYMIGVGVWPGQSFRTTPLVHLGVPMLESGMTIAVPMLEAAIASTVLGYMVAEFRGRAEATFVRSLQHLIFWTGAVICMAEATRSVFGYEGASVLRAAVSLAAAVYGGGLYHLQREHVKVVARRVNGARSRGG
jgi:hypothetical protein